MYTHFYQQYVTQKAFFKQNLPSLEITMLCSAMRQKQWRTILTKTFLIQGIVDGWPVKGFLEDNHVFDCAKTFSPDSIVFVNCSEKIIEMSICLPQAFFFECMILKNGTFQEALKTIYWLSGCDYSLNHKN